MPAEDQSEPRLRLDPPPSPAPGPARLGAPGPRFPEEPPVIPPGEEAGAARPLWRGLLPLGVGMVAGLALLAAILAVLHRSPSPPPPQQATVPAASDSGTTPAESSSASGGQTASEAPPPAATPAPPTSAAPSPAPAPAAHTPPAASPPAAPAPVAPAAPPATPAMKAPANKPVAAVPANGPKHHRHTVASEPWVVQTGAYRTEAHAHHVADQLTHAGYHTRVAPRPHGWFAIEVTGYKTKVAADAAAKKLATTQHVPVFVRRSETK
jgi:cell division protein FtsN